MGRMKSLQPTEAGIHNLFSVRYRRLVDENNHHNNNNNNNNINNNNNHHHHHHHHNNNNNAQVVMQNLIRMKLSQDYIAYCCGQCGHHQRFDIKADELHNIGDALRMSCTSVGTKTPSTDAAAADATTTTTLVISSAATTTTTQSDAKSINLPAPPVKNGHTTWTRQFHDKSSRQQSKANNIQKSATLVEVPENNLAEMSKCKCSKDAAKTLIKSNGSSSGSGGDVSKALGIGAALVMPFHSHHPVMMGYKPLLSSIDFSATSAATSAKPSTHNTSCNSSSVGTLSSCSSSRSVSPSSANESYLPTLPVRTDSLTNLEEEALLKCAPWFQAGIPREISLEILQQEPVGSFLVRESTSKPGCYALSVRVPKECQKPSIAHYLITQTNRGFKIKGFTKEFPSLTSLIVHHSVMQELLPCPLLLHRPSSGLLADYLEQNNFVDIDSSVLLELTRKKGVE